MSNSHCTSSWRINTNLCVNRKILKLNLSLWHPIKILHHISSLDQKKSPMNFKYSSPQFNFELPLTVQMKRYFNPCELFFAFGTTQRWISLSRQTYKKNPRRHPRGLSRAFKLPCLRAKFIKWFEVNFCSFQSAQQKLTNG